MDKINQLIADIKQKKELRDLSHDFVKEQINLQFNKNPQYHKILDSYNPKSHQYKQFIKIVRAQLRRVYGLFRAEDVSDRKIAVEKLIQNKPTLNLVKQVLATHFSTKERMPIYTKLYKNLFAMTGKPEIILDLGCGLNPFSVWFMDLPKEYYAYDLSLEEISHLNSFFNSLHTQNSSFRGKAATLDLLNINKVKQLPAADLAFLFKITDLLDQGKRHKRTEEMLRAIPAKFVVVSFSTKTMSGKPMTAPRRSWVEWLCERLGYKFGIIGFENELFYVVKKN